MKGKKKIISAVLFVALAALTFFAVFRGQDLEEIGRSISQIHKGYLFAAAVVAVSFVAAEGVVLWYLFRIVGEKVPFWSGMKYSFAGFFYSGITPSASGGQPMQLYYMAKDGHSAAAGSVVLLADAAIYKIVLVLIGIGIAVFWFDGLCTYLGGYIFLYFLGLFLNAMLVIAILAVMLSGAGLERVLLWGERLLVKIRFLKPSEKRKEKIHLILEQYVQTVDFLRGNWKKLIVLMAFVVQQRFGVFFLTWLIYKGLGLTGTNMWVVMMLQAVIYIAVDMLPLPGSQGITELMYTALFLPVFTDRYLTVSMCVTRGLNFYMLMLISGAVAVYCWWENRIARVRSGKRTG